MADVNANISVNIDTSAALSELKNLQRQISSFHNSIAKSSASAAIAQRNLQQGFVDSINSSGQFAARIQTIRTSAESFTNSLEKNKFSMREYFRYGIASSKMFGKVFRTEFDTVNKVAVERVRKLQTQYIKMGRDANGAMKAIAVTPLSLDMENLATKTMIAAQKQQLFNQLLKQGSTNLINFGKNTQWAGRQLMVGFTLPLTVFGSTASKVFMELELEMIRFRRVYGDLFTIEEETKANLDNVRGLAAEFVKYGVTVQETLATAADAAAAGFSGAQLESTVRQATRLSVLGEVERQEAFKATIALQTAFRLNNNELAESVNFLNAVENQSVVSLQNLTDAIPRVAPIIRGLGGDVRDMAVFLAAMQEGGVNAAEGANGLKSALASIINPTRQSREMLQGVGIDIDAIVEGNAGNLMRTMLQLGDALKTLTPLARQRILEQLFGKFQFARVSALFDNISKEGSQAQRTMELMQMSAQDLSQLANKELAAIEENTATKFKAAVEEIRAALAPVGELFLQIVTPVIKSITGIIERFNSLSDNSKKVIGTIIAVLGGVAPILLMLIGLAANFAGNFMKFFALIRNGYLKLSGQSKYLGDQTQYLSNEQMEAEAVAASLDQVHARLTQRFTSEASALHSLRNAYIQATDAARRFTINNPGMMLPTRKYNKGVRLVPGSGNQDTVPAMLTPGESVIPKDMTKKYGGLINGMIADNIPGFKRGLSGSKTSIGTSVDIPGGYNIAHFGSTSSMSGQELLNMMEGLNTAFAKKVRSMVAEVEGGVTRLFTVFSNEVVSTSAELNQMLKDPGSGKTAPVGMARRDLVERGAVRDIELKRQLEKAGVPIEEIKVINAKITSEIEEGFTRLGDITEVTAEDVNKLIDDAYNAVSQTDNRVKQAVSDMRSATTVTDPRTDSRIALSKETYTKFRGKDKAYYTGMEEMASPGEVPYSSQARFLISNNMAESLGLSSKDAARVYKQFSDEVKVKLASLKGDIAGFTAEFEKQAELAGLKTGNAYKVGVDKSNPQDMYVESRKRQSPHRLAPQDGRDDAVAYVTARDRQLIESADRYVQTDSGLIVPKGTSAGGTSGRTPQFLGMPAMPQKQSFGQRLRGGYSAISDKMSGARSTMAPMLGRLNMATMALTSVGIAASMVPGPLGEMTQKLMPVIMGIQGLAMALPMLMTPMGAVVGIVAAVATGFYLINKAQKDYVNSVKENAKNEAQAIQGSADSIRSYTEFLGEGGTPSQRQFNRVGDERFISAENAKLAKFREYYEGVGKKSANVIKFAATKGSAQALAATAQDIANRVSVFGLDPKDISANIKAAAELAGVNEIELKAKLQELLLPGGADILTTPLTIEARTKFLTSDFTKDMNKLSKNISQVTGAKAPSLGRKMMNSLLAAYAGASDKTGQQKQSFEADQARQAMIANQLDMSYTKQRESLAMLNAQYVDGKITVEEYDKAHENLMANFKSLGEQTTAYLDQLNKIDSSGNLASEAMSDLADQIFDPFVKANKKVGQKVREIFDGIQNEKIQTDILINLSRGSLTPTDLLQMDYLFKNMDGKTYEQKLAMIADLPSTSKSLKAIMELRVQYEKLTLLQIEFEREKSELKQGQRVKRQYIQAMTLFYNQKEIVDKLNKDIEKLNKATLSSPEVDGSISGDDKKDSGKDPYDFIGGLLQQLKQFRKESINASGGVKTFLNVLKKDMTGFKGMDQMLRSAGATQGFIDIVNGLDSDQLKLFGDRLYKIRDGKIIFGDLGKAIQRFSKEVELGKFNDQMQQSVVSANNQYKAYTKLRAAGLSASQALELTSDNALAAAIAAEKVDSTDFKNFVKGAKEGAKATAELAKELKNARFEAEQEAETAADKVDDFFAYEEARIRLERYRQFTQEQGMSPQEFENARIKPLEKEIESVENIISKIQEEIDLKQEQLDLFSRGTELIGREEEKINEEYDKRNDSIDSQIEALEKVEQANQRILDQQKRSTSLAEALSSGDIAAAAQIAQEMRGSAAQGSLEDSKRALEEQKNRLEQERLVKLESIQVRINGKLYTRKEIEAAILVIEDDIYEIENTRLKTQQDILKDKQDELKTLNDILRVYEDSLSLAIASIKNDSGLTKDEWNLIKDAVNTTNDYFDTMVVDLDAIASGSLSIESAWKAIEKAILAALAALKAFNAAQGAGGGGGGGGGGSSIYKPGDEYKGQFATVENKGALRGIVESQTNLTEDMILDLYKSTDKKENEDLASTREYLTEAMKNISKGVATGSEVLDYANAVRFLTGQNMVALSSGGFIKPKYFKIGGPARGTDTIPAMLTPGEFVMSKYAVSNYGLDRMKAINNGSYNGDSMYNYNLTVNVKSDANPNEIARTVMSQIKQVDSMRLRGNRF